MLIGIDGNEANIKERVGSNVYAFELISEIQKQDKDNEYIIYLRENRVTDLPKDNDNFHYRIIPPKKLWTQWRLPLDLYLHQPRPGLFFTPGHYAPRFSPIPTVIAVLDLSFLVYPDSFQPAVLHQLKSWTHRSAVRAAHILTISQSTKRDIINYYHLPEDKITVTYPGVGDNFWQDVNQETVTQIKRKYNISGKYFFTLGTHQPKKNFSRLVQAFTQLSQPGLFLVAAGKTWHQFRSDDFNPSHRVKNVLELGFVPDEDLPALMKRATAFVLPSLYEGFGIPVAEAMAVGTPVVVSNVSSLPEVVGDSGILVDPLSVTSITQGLRNVASLSDQKRVQLIRAAQARSRLFTWANCAKKTLEVLHGIAAKR